MTTYQFAGFWRRLVAYSIDGVIVGVVFIVLAIVAGLAYFSGAMSGDSQGWMSKLANLERFGSIGIVISALYALLFIAYFTYFHGLNGRTPGKKLLGLQVVSADGSPISFGIASGSTSSSQHINNKIILLIRKVSVSKAINNKIIFSNELKIGTENVARGAEKGGTD